MLRMLHMQLARRALSASLAGRRPALCVANRSVRWMSTSGKSSGDDSASDAMAPATLLPEHIKFRMPDLDFEEISSGSGGVTLSKWHAKEGDRITDGTHLVEIDTPDLVFVLDSGDEGYLARILVPNDTKDVPPGQPLAIIVPTEEDVGRFVAALKQHPTAIEGYVEPTDATLVETGSASASAATAASATTSTSPAAAEATSSSSSDAESSGDGVAVLRLLHKLHKDGHFQDEKLFKVLKSLARKNDAQLLVTYNGSFDSNDATGESFDADFFVETAVELAEEALASHETTSSH